MTTVHSNCPLPSCKTLVTFWMRIFNYLFALLAFAFSIIGFYLLIDTPSSFSTLFVLSALYLLLTSLTGILAIGSANNTLVRVYTIMFFIATAYQSVIALALLFDETTTIDFMESLSPPNRENSDIRAYLEDHEESIRGGALCVWITQVITFILGCSFEYLVTKTALDDRLEDDIFESYHNVENGVGGAGGGRASSGDSYQPLSPSSSFSGNHYSHPNTDKRRQELNNKWNNRFKTRKHESLEL